MSFVHLHLHTEYSLLDGACRIGKLMDRVKALIPILVPLFVGAFRRADELATAMECRCYHGGEGRTKLHVLKYESRDYVALVLGVLVLAAVIVTAGQHTSHAVTPLFMQCADFAVEHACGFNIS